MNRARKSTRLQFEDYGSGDALGLIGSSDQGWI